MKNLLNKGLLVKVVCGMLMVTMVGCYSKGAEEQQEQAQVAAPVEESVGPVRTEDDTEEPEEPEEAEYKTPEVIEKQVNNSNSSSTPKKYTKKADKHIEVKQPEKDNGYEYEDGILLNKQHGDHLEEEAQKYNEEEVEDNIGDEGEAWHINNDEEEAW